MALVQDDAGDHKDEPTNEAGPSARATDEEEMQQATPPTCLAAGAAAAPQLQDIPADLLVFDGQDAEVIMRLGETSKALRAQIPRTIYLAARRKLQEEHRLAVYHRMCSLCSSWVLKVNMPGPSMKVCKACWDSMMDMYSCNEWAVVRKGL